VGEKLETLELTVRHAEGRAFPLGVGGVLAADESVHAGQQLVRVERLHDVVVAAEAEAGDPIERLRAHARDEDDRQPLAELGAQLAADVVAAHAREVDVQEDEARPLQQGRAECVFPRRRLADGIAPAPEHLHYESAKALVVIDNEHGGRGHFSPCPENSNSSPRAE
jgi:hypothetical protein